MSSVAVLLMVGAVAYLVCVHELLPVALLAAGAGVVQTAVQAAVLVLPFTYCLCCCFSGGVQAVQLAAYW
jgi:hypothetical protein